MTRETRPSARTSSLRALFLLVVAALSLWAAIHHRDLPQTGAAERYARQIAVGATATYVTLRTLNAFLSSAQELEVGVSLVGQGSAQPLKFLEPLDDTVERIAGVVFAVMLAAAAIAVAMGPLGAVGFAMVALGALLGALLAGAGRGVGGLPRRLATYGAVLGLGLPLAFLLSGLAADALTERSWADHQRIVAEITATVEDDALAEAPGGWRAMMGQVESYQQLAVNLSERADELIASLIGLLAVFIVRLAVLPLVLTGALLVIARGLLRPGPGTARRRPR